MNKLTPGLVLAVAFAVAAPAFAVDFVKEIKPIFAETCYKCHGAKKEKGDLRLHSKAEIMDTDTVVIAGKPEESELFKRITLPHDHDDLMPPVDEGEPLKPEQIELIKKWIAEGASFGEWTADESHEAKEEKLPEVAAAPEEALTRLHEANALAMPLANNTNLLNVDFRSDAANVGDAQLALLRPVQDQVAWLGLAGTQVTDAGLEQIKGLKNLRRLHLEKTGVTDAGLVHLAGLTELRYLNLYGTKVSDAGLDQIKGLKNLQKLYLWQSQVTDAGEKALKEAMPNLQINRGWVAPPPPVAVVANMLTNADFEQAEADGKPTGWIVSAAEADKVQFRVIPETPKDGKASLKIVGSAAWAVATQKFPIEAGKTYNLAGFVRLHKGSAVLMFQYSKGDEFLGNGTQAALTAPSAEWQAVSATGPDLTTHPTATHISVSAVITGDTDADFDGLVLTAGAPAAATAPSPEFEKFAALAAGFKGDSCCDKAHKGKTVCEHPCCKEALAAGKVCEKCNAK